MHISGLFFKSENCCFKVRDWATLTHLPFPLHSRLLNRGARQPCLLSAGLLKDVDASTDWLLLPSFASKLQIWILALLLACSIGGQDFSCGTAAYRSSVNSACSDLR